ncbi:FemAB family PEP-CTERM system-associated protein, partial [Planctomicrobium sp.]
IGELPLVLVSGPIFGKFLVGLSYINSGGVRATDAEVQKKLIDQAIKLTEEHGCRYLELRHETPIAHSQFNAELNTKVHKRLELPGSIDELRKALKGKVRNQVKKGESQGFRIAWGGTDLVEDFYRVFSIRMRELGTPVYSKKLFLSICAEFSGSSEICCVYDGDKVIGAAILVHGDQITEVPSAATLISYNKSNVNMLMYWQLLCRSVERRQKAFDFGRATIDSPTYKFKKQWGATSHPAHWQYYLRKGSVDDMRPDSGKKKFIIQIWKHLPLWVTNRLGPYIVRGIP